MVKRILKKIPVQFIFCFLLVAFIMLISNYIVFKNSMLEIYRQTSENNRLMAKSVIRSFDDCFREVNNLIFSISMLPYDGYDPYEYENLDIYDAHLIQQNVSKLFSSQDYLEEVIIFFEESNLVITSKGTISFQQFFNKMYYNSLYSDGFWRNFAKTKHTMKVIPAAYYTDKMNMSNGPSRYLIGVVGSNKLSKSRMNILVLIDINKLVKQISQKNLEKDIPLLILDHDKNSILNMNNSNDLNGIEKVFLQSGDESIIKKENYEYYCVKSSYNSFTYINRICHDYQNIYGVISSNKIIFMVSLLFSVIISVASSLYLNRPISRIADLVADGSLDGSKNKFLQIYKGIEKLKDENVYYKNKMSTDEQEVRRSVFFKIIDDVTYYKELKGQVDTCFRVIFQSDRFFMVSFSVYYKNFMDGDENQVLSLPEEINKDIRNILKTKFQNSETFYFENMQFIALVGISQNEGRKTVLESIGTIVKEINEKTQYTAAAYVSKFYNEIKKCREAFTDVKMGMAYRNVKMQGSVVDAEKLDAGANIYLPEGFIDKLCSYILSGNIKDSKCIINDVINKNLGNNISYIKFINIITIIFNHVINIMSSSGCDKLQIAEIEREFFEKTSNMLNYNEILVLLNNIVEQSAKKMSLKNQSKLNKEFIIEYINLHYMEELYLEKMADLMDTSSNYFSSFFKKTFDINFVDYLNKVRINHAKEYLRNTNIPVNEICIKVGYINSSTFTSTFKKYSGISPTAYRMRDEK